MNIGLPRIGFIISLAILLPVALVYVHSHVRSIPDLPVNPTPLLLTALFLALLACGLGLFMLLQRLRQRRPAYRSFRASRQLAAQSGAA